ncbi:von Willebrand factor A domain-containing protein 5A-like [Scomber scombrus]|uniref:von Willebrand factor A domain-containing protein 5A-like n=1 Tax=Scomber scombrus TaxID=13677 RepID=A0AAV1PQX8_SCOSC
MAENLWSWASEHLQSLRALHVPGLENRGADLVSRGSPRLRVCHSGGSRSAVASVVCGVNPNGGGSTMTIPQFRGPLSQEAGAVQALQILGQPLQAWLQKGS